MLPLLARNWWLIAIRGIAAIVLGVLAFVWPGLTVAILVALFGAYALVDGVSLLISLVRGDRSVRSHAVAVGIMGLAGVIAGILTFLFPGWTALTLTLLVGAWEIILGVVQIVAAVRLRREISGEAWMVLGGVITTLFGLYIVLLPGAGLLSLVWLVGFWAIVFGISSLLLAWRLRAHHTGAAATAPRLGRA